MVMIDSTPGAVGSCKYVMEKYVSFVTIIDDFMRNSSPVHIWAWNRKSEDDPLDNTGFCRRVV
jgi:hypothetical protein